MAVKIKQSEAKKVHFIGIAGVGMSGLAKLLMEKGLTITGSDLTDNDYTSELASHGAKIFKGHRAAEVRKADLVVISSAISPDNVEVAEARRRGIPVMTRLALLTEFIRPYRSIMVTGTHGKTTTTGLLSHILLHLGLDPTILLGGDLKPFGNSRLGKGPYLVAELDESDGEFERTKPEIAIITNIENDHLEHYGSLAKLSAAFKRFIRKIEPKKWLYFSGDKVLSKIASQLAGGLSYGINPKDNFYAEEIGSGPFFSFNFFAGRNYLGRVRLSVPGRHNILNATAAISAALSLGLEFKSIRPHLSSFKGVARRFEIKGEKRGIKVVEDYGHHPTEIKATLAAACLGKPRRLLVIFQPHRYSRTYLLRKEFSACFRKADLLAVTAIYSASEKNIYPVTANDLVGFIRAKTNQKAFFFKTPEEAADFMAGEARSGDMILILGAGDINRVSKRILEGLEPSV